MAKPALAVITTSQTFQNWLDKTNEMVGIFQDSAITASAGGDTTTGDATLVGIFTATEVVATSILKSDDIAARSASGTITFQSPIELVGTSQIVATFNYGASGARTRYTNGSLSWDMGIENNSTGNFIIDTGVSPTKFKLSTAGTLTVPNIVVTEKIVAAEFELADGSPIGGGGGGALNDLSDVTITSPSSGQVLKYNGSAWINDQGESDTYNANKFIPTGSFVSATSNAYMAGGLLFGVPAGQLNILTGSTVSTPLTWVQAGLLVSGYIQATGFVESAGNITTDGGIIYVKTDGATKASIDQSGNGFFTGDVTTNGSASDERLKENIKPLEKGLETIEQIKTYTFNYKARPQDTHPGVIAQEIEKLVPEVVYDIEMEDGIYKAVRYQQLVPLLINAIKDLSKKVNDLETRLSGDGN